MANPQLIEALSGATSLELYELSAIIDRLLADPKRIGAVVVRLNLGRQVQFMDRQTGRMREGIVTDIKPPHVIVHEPATRSHWKMSYAAIDPGAADERIDSPAGAAPGPAMPPPRKPGREDFRRGDKVSFTDKYLQPQVGVISRINQRTATVDCEGGGGWRVPFGMLHHVTDV